MLNRMISILTIVIALLQGKYKIPMEIPTEIIDENRVATLSIPSISFFQPLYGKDDERNDLDKNIIFLKSSSMPDKKKGNVIIAGHSGNGKSSYFKNLYKLQLGEEIILNYKDKSYFYKIVNKYKVPKTGKVEVIRDSNKSAITLITCIGKKEQLIIIGEQKK